MEKALIRADLNLLKVFHVLLEERNVTKTAERLFVSQSAISKSLKRLREVFDDPLFVKSQQGLVPTVKALELTEPLGRVIQQLDSLWRVPSFDPAAVQGRIRIAAPESYVLGITSRLVLALKAAAPGLSVEFVPLLSDHVAMLESGALDFVIYLDEEYPEDVVCHHLLTEPPVLWMGESHPLNKLPELTLADICAYPFVRIQSFNATRSAIRYFDREIAEMGLSRKDYMGTGHLLIALDILSKSHALMFGPQHLSRVPALSSGVVSRSVDHIPLFNSMHMRLMLMQHERTVRSPLHQWIVEEIRSGYAVLSDDSLAQ